MKTIEIYWDDLKENAQEEIMETLGRDKDDHNWDVFPLAVIELEECE